MTRRTDAEKEVGTGDSAPPKTESFKEYVVDKCGITVVLMATMTLSRTLAGTGGGGGM